jgi:hypothetical protein
MELAKNILTTFQTWNQPNGTGEVWWGDLLFARQLAGRMQMNGVHLANWEVERELCEIALKDLELRRQKLAETMIRRFKNGESPYAVAVHFSVSEPTIFKWQQKACTEMAGFIQAQESALRNQRTPYLLASLPPSSYTRLFGADHLTEQIVQHFAPATPNWLLTLTGVGGIGKSALADAAARMLIANHHYAHMVWITYAPLTLDGRSPHPAALYEQVILALAALPHIAAQNQPGRERDLAVQAALKANPYLVVVDNVEEPDDLQHLLKQLPRFINPSHFLITSRARLSGDINAPILPIPPLSRPDSKALWRYEAGRTTLPGLDVVSEEHLDALFDRLGGNPLMIKVSVGLATQFALPDIIADLENQPTGVTDENFRRVFEQAWAALSPNARLVLQGMALISEEGTDLKHLAMINNLDEAATRAAIQELTRRSLLVVQGNLKNLTYGIHRLTSTFITANLLDWRDTT